MPRAVRPTTPPHGTAPGGGGAAPRGRGRPSSVPPCAAPPGGCIGRAGPRRGPRRRLGRRLEEVAKAVGGGYCRLQMPLRLALGVRGTVAGHRLGALEGDRKPVTKRSAHAHVPMRVCGGTITCHYGRGPCSRTAVRRPRGPSCDCTQGPGGEAGQGSALCCAAEAQRSGAPAVPKGKGEGQGRGCEGWGGGAQGVARAIGRPDLRVRIEREGGGYPFFQCIAGAPPPLLPSCPPPPPPPFLPCPPAPPTPPRQRRGAHSTAPPRPPPENARHGGPCWAHGDVWRGGGGGAPRTRGTAGGCVGGEEVAGGGGGGEAEAGGGGGGGSP